MLIINLDQINKDWVFYMSLSLKVMSIYYGRYKITKPYKYIRAHEPHMGWHISY